MSDRGKTVHCIIVTAFPAQYTQNISNAVPTLSSTSVWAGTNVTSQMSDRGKTVHCIIVTAFPAQYTQNICMRPIITRGKRWNALV